MTIYTMNGAGWATVRYQLLDVCTDEGCKRLSRDDADARTAWTCDAERNYEASMAADNGPGSFEVPIAQSRDRNPHVIYLDEDWFDAKEVPED